MKSIEKFSSSSPQGIGTHLTQLLVESSNPADDSIELVISIESESLSIKGLSSYLDIIYRIDGMISKLGYNRYVHIPEVQIEISEVRFGSVEIIIEKLYTSLDANNIIIIGIFLKYLPKIIQTTAGTGLQIFDMLNKREEYLEKKERRILRKTIRKSLNEDEDLQGINQHLKEKLVDLLDGLYVKNAHRLNSSSKFANKSVKSVRVRTKKGRKNRY